MDYGLAINVGVACGLAAFSLASILAVLTTKKDQS